MAFTHGPDNFLTVHVGFIPYMGATGEQKTKPCQHSVKLMREAGLKPDLLFCRSETELTDEIRKKLGLFCMLRGEEVISLHHVSNLYQVPLLMTEQKVGELVCKKLKLDSKLDVDAEKISGAHTNSLALENTSLQSRLQRAPSMGGAESFFPVFSKNNRTGEYPYFFGQKDFRTNRLGDWFGLANRVDSLKKTCTIAMVGK
jgi:CTP synthase (UTP-ammonia lyase)